jgi:hypothetical protein
MFFFSSEGRIAASMGPNLFLGVKPLHMGGKGWPPSSATASFI